MKTIRIPIYRTFTNWIIIVVIGSVLLPFVGGTLFPDISEFRDARTLDDDILAIMVFSMIGSALCSIPALIIMFVAHLLLNKKELPFNQHRLYQNLVHLGAASLTFLVMWILTLDETKSGQFITCLATTYPLVGLVVWNITYMIYRNKQNAVPANKEILDEI